MKKMKLEIDVLYSKEYGEYYIYSTKKFEEVVGTFIYGSGKTLKAAERQFWSMAKFIFQYNHDRSMELDKWKPFQKGDWGHIGGSWFTIYGIRVYFRYGGGMFGGRYIPFTKLNISVHNYWMKTKKKDSR